MKTALKNLLRDDEGASLVEYGLLLGLIAVAAIGALSILGGKISAMFTSVSGEL
ncbi:MAG: Flp family type IVb pilin [bacterium]|nr:Flp family type IVb pilin [bacterium]